MFVLKNLYFNILANKLYKYNLLAILILYIYSF